ncbi:hypothetical protein HPB47_024388, partial [Ixodes persulcatus]
MDFLLEHSAVLDLKSNSVTIPTEHAIPPNVQPTSLTQLDEHVTLPPRSNVLVSVRTAVSTDYEGVVESNRSLLLQRRISVARGVARLEQAQANILPTNFTSEYQHLSRVTSLASLEDTAKVIKALTLSDTPSTIS